MRNTRREDSLGKHSTGEKVFLQRLYNPAVLCHNLQIAPSLPLEKGERKKSKQQTFKNLAAPSFAPSLIYPDEARSKSLLALRTTKEGEPQSSRQTDK